MRATEPWIGKAQKSTVTSGVNQVGLDESILSYPERSQNLLQKQQTERRQSAQGFEKSAEDIVFLFFFKAERRSESVN